MPLRDTRQRCRQSPRLKFAAANVVVQPGGKPVIGKFVQSVMNPGEGVLYPNRATRLREHDRVLRRCQPAIPLYTDRDRLRDTSITAQQHHAAQKATARSHHLPTTCRIRSAATPAEMQAIADIAIEHDLWVLADEVFEMRYSGTSSSIASLPGMLDRTVILYTFSKSSR